MIRPLFLLQQTTVRAICNADDPRGIMRYMNAYSEDLRKKILEALGRGTTKSEAARTFGISRSSVKRYAKLARRANRWPPRSAPASNRSSTRPPGSCSRKTSKNDPRRPCASGARFCVRWPGSRSASRPFPGRSGALDGAEKKIAGSKGARRVPEGRLAGDGRRRRRRRRASCVRGRDGHQRLALPAVCLVAQGREGLR